MLGEVLTAIVTPFGRDGSVDFQRFRELAEHLLDRGSDGFIVAGTTGEGPTLTDDERLELFRVAVDTLRGRGTVVATTGTYDTAHSVHLTREAHDIGVDAFLVVAPYYSRPPARGIVEHFRAIAEVSDRPIVVYNIPGRVVVNIEPETMIALAEIPTVRAVKQANDDLVQARRIVDDAELVCTLRQVHGVCGRVRARPGDDARAVADRVDRGCEERQPLVVRERRRLAGRAGDDEPVRAVFDEEARQLLETVDVDGAVRAERRHDRGQDLAEHPVRLYFVSANPPFEGAVGRLDTPSEGW